MTRSIWTPWFNVALDSWRLGMEASAVIGLRTLKLAEGGAVAQAEASLMITEKLAANAALGTLALTGGLGADPARATARTLAHYRRKVRANHRRLSKR